MRAMGAGSPSRSSLGPSGGGGELLVVASVGGHDEEELEAVVLLWGLGCYWPNSRGEISSVFDCQD